MESLTGVINEKKIVFQQASANYEKIRHIYGIL